MLKSSLNIRRTKSCRYRRTAILASTAVLYTLLSSAVATAQWSFSDTEYTPSATVTFKIEVFVIDLNYQTTNPYSQNFSYVGQGGPPAYYHEWHVQFTYIPGGSVQDVYGLVYKRDGAGAWQLVKQVDATPPP